MSNIENSITTKHINNEANKKKETLEASQNNVEFSIFSNNTNGNSKDSEEIDIFNNKNKTPMELVTIFVEDIIPKSFGIFSTSDNTVEKFIKQINKENIQQFLEAFEKMFPKKPLNEQLFNKNGLSEAQQGKIYMHILECIIQAETKDTQNKYSNIANLLQFSIYFGKDLDQNIKLITDDNVLQILKSYRTDIGKSIENAIQVSDKISEQEKQNILKKLEEKISKQIDIMSYHNTTELYNYIDYDYSIEALKDFLDTIEMINIYEILDIYKKLNPNNNSVYNDILKNKYMNKEYKTTLLNFITTTLIDNANFNIIPSDDIRKNFNNEITYQINKNNPSSKYLESLTDKLQARCTTYTESKYKKPNGKIDKDYKQGNTGDCWLIASIIALAQSKKGLNILNNSIKILQNGNAEVTLKGINRTFTITQDDIKNNIQFSTGDSDVRLLEIAIDKYFQEQKDSNTKIDLNGNLSTNAYKILTGKPTEIKIANSIEEWNDIFKEKINNKDFILTVASNSDEDLNIVIEDAKTKEPIDFRFIKNHSYTVKKVDENFITIINPHNSNTDLIIPIMPFREFFTEAEICRL